MNYDSNDRWTGCWRLVRLVGSIILGIALCLGAFQLLISVYGVNLLNDGELCQPEDHCVTMAPGPEDTTTIKEGND